MSEPIKHECGIALIRLRKPYSYYVEKYGPLYGIHKLYMLMEKQHNRGQDGAGVGVIKLDVPEGTRYISRYRSIAPQPITEIFDRIHKKFRKSLKNHKEKTNDPNWLLENVAFTGEVLLGHLRYGTHGKNDIETCHPFLRQSNWRTRNLVLAGNFNMTNVDALFNKLIELGMHPKEKTDTVTVLEKIGHFIDEENQNIFEKYKNKYSNHEISSIISNELDLQRVLQRACKDFDGGYAMAGMTGHGSAFVARDPAGIRPAYYYADDEVVVVASEKPAIKSAFGVAYDQIQEIKPAHALIIDKNGEYSEKQFIDQLPKKSCSFERIYFSRGSDPAIYSERKNLGRFLVPQILEEINYDIENTVFSYIPNTAETAYLGMMDGIDDYLASYRKKVVEEGKLKGPELERAMSVRARREKLVIKDAKLRSFITSDDQRDQFVSNLYDTTYEVIKRGVDTVVILDDSIVRGTTLEKSIIKMLDKLGPKKIVIVSSAPQIRYPDCYGIDMSKIKEFVAFRAMLELSKESREEMLDEVYDKCKSAIVKLSGNMQNHVKELYEPFTYDQISKKISKIVTPKDCKAEVAVIYQTIDNLHKACPNHIGDWYFTGDYPTPGGNRVVNKAYMFFMEGKTVRAY